jgi:hypothetical protein
MPATRTISTGKLGLLPLLAKQTLPVQKDIERLYFSIQLNFFFDILDYINFKKKKNYLEINILKYNIICLCDFDNLLK